MLLLALPGLFGCAANPVLSEHQCQAQGGVVQEVGMFATPACVIPFSDAGKTCLDSSECLGLCKAAPEAIVGESASGTCQRDNQDIFGCYDEVKEGVVVEGMCLD
jgi:hypothetical protein